MNQVLDPGKLLRILWERKWLILLTTLIGLGAAFLLSQRGEAPAAPPTVYRAEATVRMQPVISGDEGALTQLGKRNPVNRTLQAHVQLLQSQAVLEKAIQKLSPEGAAPTGAKLNELAGFLRAEMFVAHLPGTDLIKVTFKSTSQEQAEATVTAIVEAYRDHLQAESRKTVEEALAIVNGNLAAQSGEKPAIGPEAGPVLTELANEVNLGTLVTQAGKRELEALQASLRVEKAEVKIGDDPALAAASGDIQGAADQLRTAAARIDGILNGTTGPTEEESLQEALSTISRAVPSIDAAVQDLAQIEQTRPYRVAMPQETPEQVAAARAIDANYTGRLVSTRSQLQGISQITVALVDRMKGSIPKLASQPQERDSLLAEVETIIRTLDSMGGAIASLRSTPGVVVEVSAQARMLRDETLVHRASSEMSAVLPSIEGALAREIRALSSQLKRVQTSAVEEAESLESSLAVLDTAAATPGTDREDVARGIREGIKDARLNIDILARQMDAMSAQLTDPFAVGEFTAIAARVGSSGDAINGAVDRLVRIESGLDDPTPEEAVRKSEKVLKTSEMVLKAQASAGAAEQGLRYIRDQLNLVKVAQDGTFDQNALREVAARGRAMAVTMQVYAHDIDPLVNETDDPAVRARLRLIAEEIRESGSRVLKPSDRILQIEEEQGSAADRYFTLRRELQALSTAPETGLTFLEVSTAPEAAGPLAPFGENVNPSLAIGAVAGFLAGVLGAVATEMIGRRIRNEEDLRAIRGLRVLGPMPKAPRAWRMNPPLANRDLASTFAGGSELLATRVQDAFDRGARVQYVSSPGVGDGKTTVAMNLAQAMSRRGRKVLFIDANLRKPDATRALGLSEREGLAEAIEQGRDLDAAVVETGGGLSVMPAGKSTASPVAALAANSFESFLRRARERYDAVIVDGPPVIGYVDALNLARQADGTILVADAGKSALDSTQEAVEALKSVGATVTGAVLNSASEKAVRRLVAQPSRAQRPVRAPGALVTKP